MATINGNNAYLEIGGVDVSGYWTDSLDFEHTQDATDVTSGANTEYTELAEGLKTTSISFSVGYDDTDLANYVDNMQPGIYTIVWGPEGNASGSRKFSSSMHVESVKLSQSVEKDKIAFEISCKGNGAPTSFLHSGTF
ncbi:MAG: hypothetical protein ACPG7F_00695 [Aggregatilineales bacterium]